MRTIRLIGTLTLAAATAMGALTYASAGRAAAEPCILHEQQVVSVLPLHVEDRVGRGTVRRLAGAELFVRAQKGLTAEWLELKLKQHLAAMQSATMKDCALDVEKVAVQVRSAGTGFAVRLTAPNRAQAEEVLRRARLLVH